jgi:hypothetical protein
MPFILLLFGGMFVIAGYQKSAPCLFHQLGQDFNPHSQFWRFALGIGIVGAAGYIKPIRPIANGFLALVLVLLVLHNGKFFQQFTAQLLPGVTSKVA